LETKHSYETQELEGKEVMFLWNRTCQREKRRFGILHQYVSEDSKYASEYRKWKSKNYLDLML
jgi:hypothetical protein